MFLTKRVSFSFMVSYSPYVMQIKLFFKFSEFGYMFFFRVGFPSRKPEDVSQKKLK